MKFRRLGKSDLQVSALGLGCWAIGGPWMINGNPAGWGIVDDAESTRAIQHALDLGINFFDTAANYGAGHSEVILGRARANKRAQVVIATKFGYIVNEEEKTVVSADDVVLRNLRQDCENSLRRLGTDYIDLYQFHLNAFPPAQAAPVRDLLEELVTEGKIRWYGWSTDNPEGACVFAQGKHYAAIQFQMNVIHDAPQCLAVCDEFDLAAIIRGPLARGFLTGKYDSNTAFAKNDNRSTAGFQKGVAGLVERLEKVRAVLASDGRTLAQGALAWLWARSAHAIPIPGFRTVKQVEENVKALEFGALDPKQMQEIERLLAREKKQ
jgi:aryl-alcohol dehydrogenase-like predicted oxidoreductase